VWIVRNPFLRAAALFGVVVDPGDQLVDVVGDVLGAAGLTDAHALPVISGDTPPITASCGDRM
jgi:hypothetical protein